MCGVAAAAAIVWTLRNAVFMSSYGALVMGLPWWRLYQPLIAGALGTTGVAMTGWFGCHLFVPNSWIALGMMATLISGIYGVGAYLMSLNLRDRDLLWSLPRRSHL